MDFKFNDDENAFRNELRQWLETELSPHLKATEGNQSINYNYETTDEEWDFNMAMRSKLAEKGWLTMAWPEEYGGQDASAIKQMIFSEEMAYHRAPGRDAFATRMLAPTLMIHGTDEQRKEFLPPIAKVLI
jgi:alkylation response protein AidB-like acyl-CoA dehydrogenase